MTLNCASYNSADKFKILIFNSLTMQIICQHLEVKQGERGEPLHIPGLIAKYQMETILMKERNLLGYFGDLFSSAARHWLWRPISQRTYLNCRY